MRSFPFIFRPFPNFEIFWFQILLANSNIFPSLGIFPITCTFKFYSISRPFYYGSLNQTFPTQYYVFHYYNTSKLFYKKSYIFKATYESSDQQSVNNTGIIKISVKAEPQVFNLRPKIHCKPQLEIFTLEFQPTAVLLPNFSTDQWLSHNMYICNS